MFNDHSAHGIYSHASVDDNEFTKDVPVADTPVDEDWEDYFDSETSRPQKGFDNADAASQRIFAYVVSALNEQEANGSVKGVTYEDIQDSTRFGYSFVKNRMAEILGVTDRIKAEPGSGRRPSRFFLLHQYLERQQRKESDSTQSSGQSMENDDYDDEQAANKIVLASMRRKLEALFEQLEFLQAEIKNRESAIAVLEEDIRAGSNF